ncbi:MAG: histidine kinase dimerization/phosphoacceptor domain -containing protein [Candidatus Paceibacterota bacterium]|jgi:chemotaxis protein methyltransferase CheR|nr:ATP-binding protein [Candidatus Paceibacterota bacterium]
MTMPPSQKIALILDPLEDQINEPFLSRAIIDTVQEPLLILDGDLRIIAASKSFYTFFDLDVEGTSGKLVYELKGKQWDIPTFRKLLEEILPKNKTVEKYEITYDISPTDSRTMTVNAEEIRYENKQRKMLLSIFDVTDQRRLERERENLSHQKDILLKEMRHRIANSLQIIASILILKAQTVTSDESRQQLEDVHDRIMSIATVQGHLDPEGMGSDVDVAPYLKALCESLSSSIIGDRRPITIKVVSEPKKVTTDEAIGLGLITTELVINAVKHAFLPETAGTVIVEYKNDEEKYWKLSVIDNGKGISAEGMERKGLGKGIIDSLTKQLDARVATDTSPSGTTVSIIHGEVEEVVTV